MVKKVMDATVGAMKSVAGVFSSQKPKVTERLLLPVLQRRQELFVVESVNQIGEFSLSSKKHASAALVSLFRGTKEKPGPLNLFNRTTNIIDLVPEFRRKRSVSFVHDHIEYDVVTFHLCTDLGQPKPEEQIAQMKKHGFVLRPLVGHPLAKDIKRVLNIA